jgi:Phosphotransferase enzyme family
VAAAARASSARSGSRAGGHGPPAAGYPWRWSVYRWPEGENPAVAQPGQAELLAEDLPAFASALHRVSPAGAPPSYRCEPLSERDAPTRAAIAQVHGLVDAASVIAVWEDALTAPGPAGRPAWIHAHLQPGNLLTAASGRLSAVIDIECAGLGDPAVDLIPAWYVLPAGRARTAFGADTPSPPGLTVSHAVGRICGHDRTGALGLCGRGPRNLRAVRQMSMLVPIAEADSPGGTPAAGGHGRHAQVSRRREPDPATCRAAR